MTERLRDGLETCAEKHGCNGHGEVIGEAGQLLLKEYQETDNEDRRVLATTPAIH